MAKRSTRQPREGAAVEREANRNPILRIAHAATELKGKPPGGSPRKEFGNVATARRRVAGSWRESAADALADAVASGVDQAVLKVKLRADAIAKSHRPHYLFEQAGRGRVLGGREIGTMLISVSAGSNEATLNAIEQNDTQHGRADVTTIESISVFGADDVPVESFNTQIYQHGALITLFDFKSDAVNAQALAALRTWARLNRVEVSPTGMGRWLVAVNARIFRTLCAVPGIREITPNATLSVPTAPDAVHQPAVPALPPPDAGRNYSVVGVFDTGVSPYLPWLQPWLHSQQNFVRLPGRVPAADFKHGTFIAGLLIGAGHYNGTEQFPLPAVKIADARVFSAIENTSQTDVLARIADALQAHPEVKVWNLSLGQTQPIRGPEFTQFARELDVLAQRHSVLFVIAAGNYTNPIPLRGWPADHWHQDDRDVINAPADSAVSLTVGSVAHVDTADGGVKRFEPAPYSRRGPGPGVLPKPEVVQYGGNCTLALEPSGSVQSVSPNGGSATWFGTSFAAPLVASLAAQVWDAMRAHGDVTPALVKAMVVHAAALHAPKRAMNSLRYFGFGVPADLTQTLLCTNSAFTTLHTVHIPRGQEIHHNFPMPECLFTEGLFRGEILITLCYPPLLDENNGAEYCRSNVSVSMGPLLLGKDRKLHFHGKVPADPKVPDEGLEESLIEHGFKWSPTKVYRHRFTHGIEAADWQLRFASLYRAGQVVPAEPQTAHAIVTIRGLAEGQPVYRDGVRALNRLGHTHAGLVTAQQLRT